MKQIIALLTVTWACVSFSAEGPKEVHWGLEKAYVPVGYDDNDRIQVTVQGRFDSTCLKVGAYRLEVDQKMKQLKVDQLAYRYQGICLQMQVPFSQTLDVGLLDSGDWSIVDANNNQTIGHLSVGIAKNPGPDDFLYAPVSDAYIRSDAAGKKELCLTGNFSDRCTTLKKVEINYSKDVIVVQPIAEHDSAQRDCGTAPVRFSHCEALPDGIVGFMLLHVRSMNGQAINKIVDLP